MPSSLAPLLKLLGLNDVQDPLTPDPEQEAAAAAIAGDSGMRANDPTTLMGLRDEQTSAMAHNLSVAKDAPNVSPGRAEWQTTGRYLTEKPGMSSYGTGATPADLSELQKDAKTDPYTGEDAQDLASFFDPQQKRKRDAELAAKTALATAPVEAQARGALAVEQAKSQGAIDLAKQQQAPFQQFLGGGRGAGMAGGPNGGMTMKPSINAKGELSLTGTPVMPALVQRAHSQLVAAREQTLNALNDAERMYPGINDASNAVDQRPTSQGWLETLTGGSGAAKYGSAMDMLSAANERLKYSFGIPTPFAKLAQEASFGNLEQMAGQLPGVRGLATITPLFKEHQSRWGKETPVQTVQRLRHMASIMDETIQEIEGGDTSSMSMQSQMPPLGPLGAQ